MKKRSRRMTTGWHTSPARSLSRKNDVCPMEKAAGHRFPSRVSRQEKVLALHTEAASSAPCSALLFLGNGNDEIVVSGGKVTEFRVRGPEKNCENAHAEPSIRSSDLVEKESWPIQVSESQFTSVFLCTLPLNTKSNAPLNFCLNEPDWPVARLNCCILHQILLQS